jgi:hypothetical protein
VHQRTFLEYLSRFMGTKIGPRPRSIRVTFAGTVMFSITVSSSASAQALGSTAAERARLAEITGDSGTVSTDSLRWGRASYLGTSFVARGPSIRIVRNSSLPFSQNDGALWAGRGWNASVTGGFLAARRIRGLTMRLAVEPMLFYSQNLPFQLFSSTWPDRSGYSNPFHGPDAASLDLPHRFGDRPLLGFDPGNSGLHAELDRFAFGATTASEWWGPAIRNALLMSNNAPGIPRFFVRTARPLRSRVGLVESQLMSGTLTKSRFFSELEADFRSISGFLFQLKPAFDTTLTFGIARVVYAPVGPDASPTLLALSRAPNALVQWEPTDSSQRSDQIAAVFVRWIFPPAGFEVYGEWARMDPPRSATELLTAPHHTGGWTLGFQWARRRRRDSFLRFQSELSYLEQSVVFRDRLTPDFYTGLASPHGYTQRGQLVGAAIGPGGSSQFIAADWLAPVWQIGAFVGRVRWDNDAMYRQPGTTYLHHDVSLLSGLRAAWRSSLSDLSAELTIARRYNYLFQHGSVSPPGLRTIDVNNVTLSLVATPR